MKRLLFILFSLFTVLAARGESTQRTDYSPLIIDSIPAMVKGNFADDYGIKYSVTDSVWTQHPNVHYHIIKWNTKEQYIIARNDNKNPSEPSLYTRIDYMTFANMEPFLWGFCLTVYNAKTDKEAEAAAAANRQNPRKGCNGYPFSRMKRN